MDRLSRRGFLAASAAAAGTFGSGHAPGDEPDRRGPSKPVAANDKVVLGVIGVGGMGSGLLRTFKGLPGVEVASVCDVYKPHLLRAKAMAGGRVTTHRDFREVLDRKDVDAVVVATPDHWHAIPTVLACQAGKDVYCEKPLAYRVAEGRAMVEAARKAKRVTQMGNLMHAGENYRRVVEIVRSGLLGTISQVRLFIAADRRGLGSPPDGPPPEGCDYDAWLGPAPKRPFNPNRFTFNWRYFWDYGNGILLDFICHILDPVHWALELESPESVVASGGRYALVDNAETPDTLEVVYHYARGPKGFDLVWSQTDASTHKTDGRKMGIIFRGLNATLVADYRTFDIYPEKGTEVVLPPKSLHRPASMAPDVAHRQEWVDAIRSRKECSCNFEYGHRLTTVGHLGNIALWTGERLRWDGASEKFTSHPEANRFLARETYRAPWTFPTA